MCSQIYRILGFSRGFSHDLIVVSEVGISSESNFDALFNHIVIGNTNFFLWLDINETNKVNGWLQELEKPIWFAVGIN